MIGNGRAREVLGIRRVRRRPRPPGAVVLAGALLWLAIPGARAQQTIATDRPGLGFSSLAVPPGAVQLELGAPAFSLRTEAGARDCLVNFPALVRFGLVSGAELRLGTPLFSFLRESSDGTATESSGFGGLEVGAKLAAGGSGGWPAVALIPSVVLPVGDARFAGQRPSYTLNAVTTWALPQALGLNLLGGIAIVPDGTAGHTTTGALAAALGRWLSQRLSGYLEAGAYPTPGGENPAYVGAGATWLLRRRLQLDAFVDRGLDAAAEDWLFGLGAAVRLRR